MHLNRQPSHRMLLSVAVAVILQACGPIEHPGRRSLRKLALGYPAQHLRCETAGNAQSNRACTVWVK